MADKKCVVKPCTCTNTWQDKKYGKGNRLHNPTAKGHRCTICEKVS